MSSFSRSDGVKPAPLAESCAWSYRYAWTLQGVHATARPQARAIPPPKLATRALAEPLAHWRGVPGGRDRRPLLELAWRALVHCQFHDAIAAARGTTSRARPRPAHELSRQWQRGGAGSVHDLVHHDPDAARDRAATPSPALVVWKPRGASARGVMIATSRCSAAITGRPARERVPVEAGYRPFARRIGRPQRPVQVLDRRIGTRALDAAHHYPDQDEVDEVRIAFGSGRRGLGLANRRPDGWWTAGRWRSPAEGRS